MQRRGDPEDQTRRQRHRERQQQHRPIDAERHPIRDRRRQHARGEEVHDPGAQQGAQYPTQHGQDQALRQQLSHQPDARGAERLANRHLPLAPRSARQQQVGDVGAGDQQHEPNRAEHDEEDRRTLPAMSSFIGCSQAPIRGWYPVTARRGCHEARQAACSPVRG